MSEDWFEVVGLADGRVFLQGSNAAQELICRELTAEEYAKVDALQGKHDAAMQRLLRELSAP